MKNNRIYEPVTVTLSTFEIAHINGLLDRDEPMSAKQNDKSYMECPKCGHSVTSYNKFCSECGQRIDTQNIAL